MTTKEIFKQFAASTESGIEGGLDFLEQQFRDSGQYHRLFDVLKMQIRHDLGLTLLHQSSAPPLEKETQRQLERRFLDACRELAGLFFDQGNLHDGWMYLQPISDEPAAKELLGRVTVSEENYQGLIEIAFNERVSPVFGYRLLLQKCGTCDGITAFDMQATPFDRATISELASVLLNHFYEELRGNIASEILRKKGNVDEAADLDALLVERDRLCSTECQHVDATHLASVIRIARQTVARTDRERAISLANYGLRLDEELQLPSDAPFEDTYRDHRIWFETLTGNQVEAGIEHFTDKARQAKGQPEEVLVAEALVDLQIQAGFRDEAVASTVERILPILDADELPVAAFEVAATPQQYGALAAGFREHKNFSAYAFSLLCQQELAEESSNDQSPTSGR